MTRGKPCTQLSALSWHLCVTPSNPLHRGWDASPIWFFTVSPHTKRIASCEWSQNVLKLKICILARFTSYLERTEDVLKLLLSSCHQGSALLPQLPLPPLACFCFFMHFVTLYLYMCQQFEESWSGKHSVSNSRMYEVTWKITYRKTV